MPPHPHAIRALYATPISPQIIEAVKIVERETLPLSSACRCKITRSKPLIARYMNAGTSECTKHSRTVRQNTFIFFLNPDIFFLRTPFRAFFLCLSDIYFFGTQNISAQGLSRHSPAYIMRRPIFIRREQIRRTPITCAIRKFVPRFFLRRKALRTGSYPLPPPLPPHSAAPLLFCRALLRRSLA